MFTELTPIVPRRLLWVRNTSLGLHGLFLLWLLHAPRPDFIAPSSVAYGKGGSTVTQLYWPTPTSSLDATGQTRASEPTPRVTRARVTWQPPETNLAKQPDRSRSLEEATTAASASTNPGESVSAGTPYGSVGSSSLTGDEIRPALPVTSFDPIVSASDLVGVVEGDVVVEITIDEKGNIIQKTVLKPLSPAVDAKVLAALENWRFRPATKNGVAIPSKQDVYYHFKGSNG